MTLNPLFGLYFNLSGRWRQHAVWAIGLLVIVALGASMQNRLAGQSLSEVMAVWAGLLTFLQGIAILMIGPGSVRKAITGDFKNNMIESHRLTPMSNFTIAVGYLIGPMLSALVIFALAGLIAGAMVAVYVSQTSMKGVMSLWYVVQAAMVLMAYFYGAFTLMTAVAAGGKGNPVGIMILLGVIGMSAVKYLPGLLLLTGTYSGVSLFQQLAPRSPGAVAPAPPSALLLGLTPLLQVLFGSLFIAATCRKIRAPERPLFDSGLATLLLAICGAALVVAVAVMPTDPYFGPQATGVAPIVFVSTAAFMVISQILLAASADEAFIARRSAAYGDVSAARARSATALYGVVPWLVGGATLAVYAMTNYWMPGDYADGEIVASLRKPATAIAIAAALLLSSFTDFQIFRIAAATRTKPLIVTLIAFLVLKLLPLMAEGGMLTWIGPNQTFGVMNIGGASPLGTLAMLKNGVGEPLIGLGVQAILAVGLFAWATQATKHALKVVHDHMTLVELRPAELRT